MRLGVWEHNTNAVSLYRHRGYEEFGQHVFMFGEEEQRDVLSLWTSRPRRRKQRQWSADFSAWVNAPTP